MGEVEDEETVSRQESGEDESGDKELRGNKQID